MTARAIGLAGSLIVLVASGSGGPAPEVRWFDGLDGRTAAATSEDASASAKEARRELDKRGITGIVPLGLGTGYRAPTSATWYRLTVAGAEQVGRGNLAVDPWQVACAGSRDLPACLRSRYLPATEDVCQAYRLAFGVPTCGPPAGGWSRGPSNERWGAAKLALEYLCESHPELLGGRRGFDCVATATEIVRLGAHGGERLVDEARRLKALDVVDAEDPYCGDGVADAGETCLNCPGDVGPCPPPVDPPPTARRCVSAPGDASLGYRPSAMSTGRLEIRLISAGGLEDCPQ